MCNDFTICNGYSCCAKKGKMRVQCGSDKPHMCDLSERCQGGKDHCCGPYKSSCNNWQLATQWKRSKR